MAEKILILSESGKGKSTSIRNLDPDKTMVIQAYKKRLPFKHDEWKTWNKETQKGSLFTATNFATVEAVLLKMDKAGKEVVIIDDFVYLISGKVLDDTAIKGFDKWNELGLAFMHLMETIDNLRDNMRVYILTHTDTNDMGQVKMKTAGKLIDNLITPAGLFTIVLGMAKTDDQAFFITNGSTMDPYKSPMDMFKDKQIPNDLKVVDETVCKFWGIK